MNPNETQQVLDYIYATWPRSLRLSEDATDAWATALVAVDFQTAMRAVKDHALTSNFPPDLADLGKAQRLKDREQRPASSELAAIRAADLAAARDRQQQKRRTAEAMARLGPLGWTQALDDAKTQLVAEYGHEHIPTPLIAKRACDLADIQAQQ